jgi:hypothetical protein
MSGLGEESGIEIQPVPVGVRKVVVGLDGIDGARWHALSAVDARFGVDVEHLGSGVARFARGWMDAVDRAGRDAAGVVAAALGYDVGHDTAAVGTEAEGLDT